VTTKVLVVASFDTVNGYSTCGEHIIKQLVDRGYEVGAKHLYLGDVKKLPEVVKTALAHKFTERPDLGICFAPPGRLKTIAEAKFRVAWSMHESTTTRKIHPTWVNHINNNCDALLVPSVWSQHVFLNDGVHVPTVVVPLGVEPRQPNPNRKALRKDKPYIFFTFGKLNYRKAPDEMMQVFREAFPTEQDVRLVLKTVGGFFGLSNTFQVNDPRITIINSFWETDHIIKYMQSGTDVGIWLCRGEGFNIPPLEAMSAGLPVILANNTGSADFADPRYCLPVRTATWVPCRLGGFWATPDWKQAGEKMRYCYEHRDEVEAMGQRVMKWVTDNWTWKHSIDKLVSMLGLTP